MFVPLRRTIFVSSSDNSYRIPIGVLAFAMSFTGPLSRRISPKWIILFGQGILIVATILLAFADGPDKYWPFVFPAFILGSAGAMLTYTHTKWVHHRHWILI